MKAFTVNTKDLFWTLEFTTIVVTFVSDQGWPNTINVGLFPFLPPLVLQQVDKHSGLFYGAAADLINVVACKLWSTLSSPCARGDTPSIESFPSSHPPNCLQAALPLAMLAIISCTTDMEPPFPKSIGTISVRRPLSLNNEQFTRCHKNVGKKTFICTYTTEE